MLRSGPSEWQAAQAPKTFWPRPESGLADRAGAIANAKPAAASAIVKYLRLILSVSLALALESHCARMTSKRD